MCWIIIGVVIFFITLFTLNILLYRRFDNELRYYVYKSYKLKIYKILLLIILSFIPIINLIFFIILLGIHIALSMDNDIKFKKIEKTSVLYPLFNFLNKEIKF